MADFIESPANDDGGEVQSDEGEESPSSDEAESGLSVSSTPTPNCVFDRRTGKGVCGDAGSRERRRLREHRTRHPCLSKHVSMVDAPCKPDSEDFLFISHDVEVVVEHAEDDLVDPRRSGQPPSSGANLVDDAVPQVQKSPIDSSERTSGSSLSSGSNPAVRIEIGRAHV